MRGLRRIWLAGLLGLSGIAVSGLGCDTIGLVAPEGASLSLYASPTTVSTAGDSSQLGILLLDSGGEPVEDGTGVALSTNLGSVCGKGSNNCGDTLRSILTAKTRKGIAQAVFHSGGSAGSATITARSGGASATVTITISGLVAPQGSEITLVASPDAIAVNTGSSLIDAFVANANVPVPDGTRLRFLVSRGSITPAIATTQDGFARATLRGVPDTGTIYLKAVSGVVLDSIPIVVR